MQLTPPSYMLSLTSSRDSLQICKMKKIHIAIAMQCIGCICGASLHCAGYSTHICVSFASLDCLSAIISLCVSTFARWQKCKPTHCIGCFGTSLKCRPLQAGCIDNDQLVAQTACRPAAPLPHYLPAPGPSPFCKAGKALFQRLHFVAL